MPAKGKPEFVHLHNHSEYSLLDGTVRLSDRSGGPSELLKSLARDGAKGMGLTDHGNMYGAVEFYSNATKVGLKPIVGCEMYLAKGKRTDRGHSQKENCHLTVLARDFQGYQNLMELVTLGFTEGYYYDPRIDKELLAKHGKGLIVLSGCLKSEISQLITAGNLKEAEKLVGDYRDILEPGSFFLEIMDHGIDKQRQVNKALLEIHERTKIPLVVTNDCHYSLQSDFDAHDARVCISTGRQLADVNRLKFESHEFYFKSPRQMHELFDWAPEGLRNTLKIAEMCHLQIPMDQMLLPEFVVPEGHDQNSYLEMLCLTGLKERLGSLTVPYRDRLDYELGVIRKMGFSGYFLIVWDFIKYARSQGIPVGPGRGSGAGAIVAYALRITNVDPIKHNLLFERFLNPDRKSMPDLDIDFADTGRDRVIEYVRNKYGAANVAQIITFGSMAARLVVRDVGRVMGVPLSETDRIAKLIPAVPGTTLYETMQKNPEMVEAAKDPQIKKLLDLSLKLEGLKRHTGVHAAGTVITKEPVVRYSPLARGGKSEVVTTQYDGDVLPKLGLLKVDFLGLRTLSIIDDAIKAIRARGNPGFDIDAIPMEDEKTFALLRSAKALAVFQLDSQGMRDLLFRMKPSDFNDIVSLIALFRPGPMQSGMLDMFVERKHGVKKIAYDHALLEPILKDTYGCIVFQEQVMEISKRLADFTPGQADGLRKAMGKKIPEELEKMRDTFVKGAAGHKIAPKLANKIYDQLVQFGGYGFNKCLAGSTRVFDAATGRLWTIEDLCRTGKELVVWSLDEDQKGVRMPLSRVWSNGVRQVFTLKTKLGKVLRATGNHPFLRPDGWINLEALRAGDRLAAPRLLPAGALEWPAHKPALLGWVLSEGNTCHPSGFYMYSKDAAQAEDMARQARAFDNTGVTDAARRGLHEVYVRAEDTGDGRFVKGKNAEAGAPSRRSGARLWLESLGLVGCSATQKFVPDEAFGLSRESLSILIGRMWSGDGFICSGTNTVPFYATSSRRLAADLQELLLRLGIVSRVAEKRFRYRGGFKPGCAVYLIGGKSVTAFIERIGPHLVGRDKQLGELKARLASISRNLTSKDTVPVNVWTLARRARAAAGTSWPEIEAKSGVSTRDFCSLPEKKKGFRRETIAALAEHFSCPDLANWAESGIYWDTVESIEPAGSEETFDLEVPGAHNFVAGGVFVHNSHSAAYGLVAYQTAYLKANHPLEFMAAVATSEIGHSSVGAVDKENKLVTYLEEARHMGIKITPPDVQRSGGVFTIEDPNSIRFGLVAVKNVGEGAVDSILKAREDGPFKDLGDFCARVDLHAANKKVLESLVKAGALDSLEPGPSVGATRGRLLAELDDTINRQARLREDISRGQGQLFGAGDLTAPASGGEAKPAAALPEVDVLKFEKEVLGFYFSGHPLIGVRSLIRCAATHEVAALNPGITTPVRVAGMMSQVKRMVTKSRGEQYARCVLEDLSGEVALLVFPKAYASGLGQRLKVGEIVAASGRLSFKGEGPESPPELIVDDLQPLDSAVARYARRLRVSCDPESLPEATLEALRDLFEAHAGSCPVTLEHETPDGTAVLELDQRVLPSQKVLESLEKILGERSWRIESASS